MMETIDRSLPQLVKLLLASKKGEEEKDDIYEQCVEYGFSKLKHYTKPPSCHLSVWQNMENFVDRYECDAFPILGQTFRTLAHVVIDDKECVEDLKWTLLDFMLSVNYRAFRHARIHNENIMLKRQRILNDLERAYEKIREQNKEPSTKYFNTSTLNSDSDDESQTSQVSVIDLGPEIKPDLLRESNSQNAILSLSIAMSKLKHSRQQLKKPGNFQAWEVQLPTFAESFGDYLQNKLQYVNVAEKKVYVIRELLLMFFQPRDCGNFQLVQHLLQVRKNAVSGNAVKQLLQQQFLIPLQQMQQLRQQLEMHSFQQRSEVIFRLIGALRRLLKPAVESLTHFERCLALGTVKPSLRILQHDTAHSFQRLELLWNLSSDLLNKAKQTQGKDIVSKLLQLTAQSDSAAKGYAASLLLYVLQVHCQFLDNWWQRFELHDVHNEMQLQAQHSCPLFKLFKQHIESTAASLGLLKDTHRLQNFVAEHKTLLEKELHTCLIKSVVQQLKHYYQTTKNETQPKTTPDIFEQMRSTQDSQLKELYFIYYKETLSDFPLDLLRRCQRCAAYAPLEKLIWQNLERLLEERSMLLNSFVSHLLRVELQLQRGLHQLQTHCLLFNFELFAEQFESVFHLLQAGESGRAAVQLLLISNEDPSFFVLADTKNPFQLKLSCSWDNGIHWIINNDQLESYNAAFCHLLQLHVTLRKLKLMPEVPQQLPELPQKLPELPQLPQQVPELSQQLPEVPQQLPELPQKLPEIPELPQQVPEMPQQMPEMPQQLSELPQQLPELPQQLPEMPQLSELPQQLPEMPKQLPELPQQLPEMPQQLPEMPQQLPEMPQQLPEMPQQLPEMPQQLPELPQQLPEMPQQLTELTQQLTELPQQLPEMPQQLTELTQQLTELPQQLPEMPQQLTELTQQLAELPQQTTVATAALLSLQSTLMIELEKRCHTLLLQHAAFNCDKRLQCCNSLPELEQVHAEFVQHFSEILFTENGAQDDLQLLFRMSRILLVLWQRFKSCCKLTEEQYELGNNRYLLSIGKLAQNMKCLLTE